MKGKEYMPEDEDKLDRLDGMVSEILRSLKGDPFNSEIGLIDRFKAMELRVAVLESFRRKIVVIAVAFVAGVLLSGVFFGIYTLRAVMDAVK